jgi:hypothetical protein
MIFGMNLHAYTQLHVLISLVAIGSGLIVMYGMLTGKRLDRWTSLFLATTVLTSVTGFGFPFTGVTPAIRLGIISWWSWGSLIWLDTHGIWLAAAAWRMSFQRRWRYI